MHIHYLAKAVGERGPYAGLSWLISLIKGDITYLCEQRNKGPLKGCLNNFASTSNDLMLL